MHNTSLQYFGCSYCKAVGHTKSTCLKLLTKTNIDNYFICRDYNRFLVSKCEITDTGCSENRQHLCFLCGKEKCKAFLHINGPQNSRVNTTKDVPSYENLILKLTRIMNQIVQTLSQMQTNIEHLSSHPNRDQHCQSSDDISPYRNKPPTDNHQNLSSPLNSIVKDKGILTTDVICMDKQINLPISSALPFSSVNEEFAQFLTSRDPYIKISYLPSSVPSSLITSSTGSSNGDLHSFRIIEVPITWNTGHRNRFQMLVVPDLSHSIVFGHNHLKKTKAIIDHDSLQITFKHSNMNFSIQCRIKSDNHVVHLATA